MYRVTYRYNGDPRDRPVNPDKCPAGVLMENTNAVFRQCRASKHEDYGWCLHHMHYKERRRVMDLARSQRSGSQVARTLRRRVHKLEKMLGIEGE